MKFVNEKNKSAHSVERAQLRNTGWGAACRKYIAGCLRVHPVYDELNVLTGVGSVIHGLPSDASVPKLPLQPVKPLPIKTFGLPQPDNYSETFSRVASMFETGRLLSSLCRAFQDMSQCVAVAEKQQIQRYKPYFSLQDTQMRQGGPEVQCDVCICRLQFGKSMKENKDSDLQNMTYQRGLKKQGQLSLGKPKGGRGEQAVCTSSNIQRAVARRKMCSVSLAGNTRNKWLRLHRVRLELLFIIRYSK